MAAVIQLKTQKDLTEFYAKIKRPVPQELAGPEPVAYDAAALGIEAVSRALGGYWFADWMLRHGLDDAMASSALGCSKTIVRGFREARGPVPKYIALACSAYSFGLPAMKG